MRTPMIALAALAGLLLGGPSHAQTAVNCSTAANALADVATQGEGGTPRRIALYKENIARFSAGEQLRNVVDKQKGY